MDLSRLAVIEVDNKVNISVLHSMVRIEIRTPIGY
jgi:hypothetical protein